MRAFVLSLTLIASTYATMGTAAATKSPQFVQRESRNIQYHPTDWMDIEYASRDGDGSECVREKCE